MAGRAGACCFVMSGLMAAIAVGASAAQTPEGVSPGAPDRIAVVEGRCPSFYWSGVTGAAAYELVVYRLPEEPGADVALSPSDLALSVRLPGGATAWQPELAQALSAGADYVWFVRAVVDANTGAASEWSTGRFFSISAVPSVREVEEALMTLQRYVESGNDGGGVAAQVDDGPATHRSAGTGRVAGAEPEVRHTSLKDRQAFTAAILGQIADPSGLAFGVVGFSSSPDGGGMAAANLGGGPDLVLDGAADGVSDTNVYQDRLEVPSAGPRTFSFSNPGGGGLTLDVDGVEVTTVDSDLDAGRLTTGTIPNGRLAGAYTQALTLSNPGNDFTGSGAGLIGVDADTLDGIDGAGYATDAEAAALVAVHAASADHDGRYYTKTELSTTGTPDAVHWDNLGGVPAGFADGIDDNTTYTAGRGLIVDGGEIRVDPSAFSSTIATVDNTGTLGSFTSIAIGDDGLGLISYYDISSGDLKVAHCDNDFCSSATTATLDSTGNVGQYTSIAIGADGLGLISYYDTTNGDLKVAHCSNAACTSASTAIVNSTGDVGQHTSIAVGSDGRGLISYYDVTNGDLRVAHCVDLACSLAFKFTLDSADDAGQFTSIAIGTDGLGIISYLQNTYGLLKVAHCNDVNCSTASIADVDSGGVGAYSSISIDGGGLALISYYDFNNNDLKVARCNNTECSSSVTTTVDSNGIVGQFTSVTIGPDGLGLISYTDTTNGDLKTVRCNTVSCLNNSSATVDTFGFIGYYSSITVGADGLGLISYYDLTNGDLKVAHLGIGVP